MLWTQITWFGLNNRKKTHLLHSFIVKRNSTQHARDLSDQSVSINLSVASFRNGNAPNLHSSMISAARTDATDENENGSSRLKYCTVLSPVEYFFMCINTFTFQQRLSPYLYVYRNPNYIAMKPLMPFNLTVTRSYNHQNYSCFWQI